MVRFASDSLVVVSRGDVLFVEVTNAASRTKLEALTFAPMRSNVLARGACERAKPWSVASEEHFLAAQADTFEWAQSLPVASR